jgi:hypothetical protein
MEGLVVGDEVAALVEAAADGPGDTRSRLVAAYRVALPALVGAYERAAIGDAAAAVVAEDEQAMQEAERLLANLAEEIPAAKSDEDN